MSYAHTASVDLRLLNTFRTVVSTGSVSAAAEVLLVSQPAVSRQLQQLERQAGVRLFDRQSGRLRLTAAGQEFLVVTGDVLSAAENARSLADSLAAGKLARVRICAPTTTLTDVIAPFLATLSPQDPLITVTESAGGDDIRRLGTDRDLAILTTPPPRRFANRRVASLPVWAHVHPGHRVVSASREVVVEELAEETLLLLPRSARARTITDEALTAAGLSATSVVECEHPQVAQGLAAAGFGVAVLSDDARFGLVPLHIVTAPGAEPLMLTLYAAWDPRHHAAAELSSLSLRLEEFCAQRYGDLGSPHAR